MLVAQPGQRHREGPCRPEHEIQAGPRRWACHGQAPRSRTARSCGPWPRRAQRPGLAAAPRAVAQPCQRAAGRPRPARSSRGAGRRQSALVTPGPPPKPCPPTGWTSCARLCCRHGGLPDRAAYKTQSRKCPLGAMPPHAPLIESGEAGVRIRSSSWPAAACPGCSKAA